MMAICIHKNLLGNCSLCLENVSDVSAELEIDDSSWEALFWSLMAVVEGFEELTDVFEVFEVAGLELDAEEGDDE